MEQTMGKRIAAARKAKGLTQDQLAEKLGVTAQAVSKWENDLSCPDISTLPALADIFNVTVDELLGRPSADTESRDRPLVGEVIHQAEEDTDSDDGGYEGKNSLRVDIHTGRRGGLGFAAFLLAVGALALTSVILEKDWSLWSLIWPTALIMIGLTSLWNRFSFFSAGMALAGTYFLLNNIGVLHYSQSNRLILPLCILLIGLTILVDTFRKPKKRRFSVTRKDPGGKHTTSEYDVSADGFSASCSFGSDRRNVCVPLLRGGNASCSFGELTVDLSGCPEVAPECVLDLDCSFGQLTLLLPRRMQADLRVSKSFGDLEVSGKPNPDAVPVHINADVSFGEIEIQYI